MRPAPEVRRADLPHEVLCANVLLKKALARALDEVDDPARIVAVLDALDFEVASVRATLVLALLGGRVL